MYPQSLVIQEASKRPIYSSPWFYAFILIFTGGGYFLWQRARGKAAAQEAAEALQGDIFTRQAASIKNAIEGIGTDEEALFKVAREITDWKKVAQAYQTLTKGNNIEQDLSDELSPKDYKKFMNFLQFKGRRGSTSGSPILSNPTIFIGNTQGPANMPIGSRVFINWQSKLQPNLQKVHLYSQPENYPLTRLQTINRPTNTTPKLLGRVEGFNRITYANDPNTIVTLVKVNTSTRSVWVRTWDLGVFTGSLKGTDLILIK